MNNSREKRVERKAVMQLTGKDWIKSTLFSEMTLKLSHIGKIKPVCTLKVIAVSSYSMANKNGTLRCTFSAPSHSATLLQGLSVLRDQGQLLDVVLAINEERFQVHKAVLASCSDYFRWVGQRTLP